MERRNVLLHELIHAVVALSLKDDKYFDLELDHGFTWQSVASVIESYMRRSFDGGYRMPLARERSIALDLSSISTTEDTRRQCCQKCQLDFVVVEKCHQRYQLRNQKESIQQIHQRQTQNLHQIHLHQQQRLQEYQRQQLQDLQDAARMPSSSKIPESNNEQVQENVKAHQHKKHNVTHEQGEKKHQNEEICVEGQHLQKRQKQDSREFET